VAKRFAKKRDPDCPSQPRTTRRGKASGGHEGWGEGWGDGGAECPRRLHIDLGGEGREGGGAPGRPSYIVIGPRAVIRPPYPSPYPALGDYCHWGTNLVVHFRPGDFNNNEDKVFTFAAGAAIIVYGSAGSRF